MIEAEWNDERSGEGLLQPRAATVCLTEEEVEAFLFDRLSGTTRENVEEHLLYCESCLRRVEHEQDFVQVMRDACGGLEAADLAQSVRAVERERWWHILRWPELKIPVLAMSLAAMVLVVVPWGQRQARSPVEVALRVERGSAPGGAREAPADRPLVLKADLAGLPVFDKYVVSLVDSGGRLQEEKLVGAATALELTAGFKAHGAGQYWVRVYTPDRTRELLREYSIVLR